MEAQSGLVVEERENFAEPFLGTVNNDDVDSDDEQSSVTVKSPWRPEVRGVVAYGAVERPHQS